MVVVDRLGNWIGLKKCNLDIGDGGVMLLVEDDGN